MDGLVSRFTPHVPGKRNILGPEMFAIPNAEKNAYDYTYYNSSRKAFAECVTTRGQTRCSPASGTPPPADDLTEEVPVVPAVVFPNPSEVTSTLLWVRALAVLGLAEAVIIGRRATSRPLRENNVRLTDSCTRKPLLLQYKHPYQHDSGERSVDRSDESRAVQSQTCMSTRKH